MKIEKSEANLYFSKSSKCPEDCEEFAWLMKSFECESKDFGMNSVECYSFEKGDRKNQSFGPVCLKSCYVVYYMFNSCESFEIFDDMLEAMEFAKKCIEFIKA